MAYTVTITELSDSVNVTTNTDSVTVTEDSFPITVSYNAVQLDGVNVQDAEEIGRAHV